MAEGELLINKEKHQAEIRLRGHLLFPEVPKSDARSVETQQPGVFKAGEVTMVTLLGLPREALKQLAFRRIYDSTHGGKLARSQAVVSRDNSVLTSEVLKVRYSKCGLQAGSSTHVPGSLLEIQYQA